MKKKFVIDLSVITSSPYSLLTFDENTIIIPFSEFSRLDSVAVNGGERGRNAANALSILDDLSRRGNLRDGVELPSGGLLFVGPEYPGEKLGGRLTNIVSQVSRLEEWFTVREGKGKPVKLTLISDDPSVRVNASICGVKCEQYRTGRVEINYQGRSTIAASRFAIDEISAMRPVEAEVPDHKLLLQGEYLKLESPEYGSALAYFYDGKFMPLRYGMRDVDSPFHPYGVKPRNDGQIFAVDAMMAPAEKVPMVILKGPAGTAKTFLALACGLEQVVGSSAKKGSDGYSRILVARPNIKFDEDIGFLKGTEEDKIGPLIRPIWDNLEQLTRTKNEKEGKKVNSYAQYLFDSGYIVAQAMAYMRGRSISNTWVIIDEAQNMTPLQAFGIISRVGIGTKIILAGDPEQVDAPNLDQRNNGLSFASERMMGSTFCRQITFGPEECERSPLALEAIKRLSLKGQMQ